MDKPTPADDSVDHAEKRILQFWRDQAIFAKSLAQREGNEPYIFYDGPPFATGTPHYGHILASAIKDAVPRYQTMRGKYVARRWGWDTHGLPIENIVEKKLGISGKKQIEQVGVEKFNQTAREQVLTYVDDWQTVVERMARWVDFDGSYKTMDNDYIESVWWAFGQLYDKGLVYEGTRVLPYCPRCETPVAQSEIAMDNSYREISDLSVYVQSELVDEPGTYLVVWTTTPWTLPGNTAAAVNPALVYVTIEHAGKRYIVSKERAATMFDEGSYVVINEQMGSDLVGKRYQPIVDYFIDADLPNKENGWKIYPADYVTEDMGSGIVHLAPAFGEIDMDLARIHNIPFVVHVTPEGRFIDRVTDFAGLPVKPKDDHQSTDVEIIKYLAGRGLLLKKEKIVHSYPHCFRCDTPLFYYALPAWFVKIQDAKPRLAELNETIHWVPDHLKHGRFLKSMQGAPDWNISRNRFWASPLPIWKCLDGHVTVVDSVQKLKDLAGSVPDDLHRPHIDQVVFPCPTCTKEARRIPEVFDCWFESGSMPFAAVHYPFENKEWFHKNFPGDFVAEYIAQTRTWFYYMHVVATLLFDDAPFRHVVTTGNILAEDGQKMSKRKQNYPDPMILFEKYGVDALRYYLLASPVMKSEDINFSEQAVGEVYRKLILRVKNVVAFLALYPTSDDKVVNPTPTHVLDHWILSRLSELIRDVTDGMERYELDVALRPIELFVDDLSVWYLRRSRDRLKEGSDLEAARTLRVVLRELAKVLAPFTPFVAEEVYRALRGSNDPESVHLTDWPTPQSINEELVRSMTELRSLVTMGLEARNQAGIKVRQPLARATITTPRPHELLPEMVQIYQEELNVETVEIKQGSELGVELDTVITDELEQKGLIRELCRAIQHLRKEANLAVGEQAKVYWQTDDPRMTELLSRVSVWDQVLIATILEHASHELSSPTIVSIHGATIHFRLERVV